MALKRPRLWVVRFFHGHESANVLTRSRIFSHEAIDLGVGLRYLGHWWQDNPAISAPLDNAELLSLVWLGNAVSTVVVRRCRTPQPCRRNPGTTPHRRQPISIWGPTQVTYWVVNSSKGLTPHMAYCTFITAVDRRVIVA